MSSSSKAKYDCLPQFLSALAVSLSASVVGGWMSFTSVAIPKMMNNTAQSNLSTVLEYQDPITIDLHEGILDRVKHSRAEIQIYSLVP